MSAGKIIVPLDAIDDYVSDEDVRVRRNRFDAPRRSILDLLAWIEPADLCQKYVELYNAFPFYAEAPGGAKHHHWWVGGLEEHVKEMVGWMLDQKALYKDDLKSIPVTDIVASAFLHDFDKVWIYQYISDEDRARDPKKFHEQQVFRSTWNSLNKVDGYNKILLTIAQYGIIPTEDQWSAILFHHGGWSPYAFGFAGQPTYTGDNVMHSNPLAVLLSQADMYSSQILGRSLI